jgi:hypothetical protein
MFILRVLLSPSSMSLYYCLLLWSRSLVHISITSYCGWSIFIGILKHSTYSVYVNLVSISMLNLCLIFLWLHVGPFFNWFGLVYCVWCTFNNISVTSWRSVLLVEETRENHWPVASHWQTLSHNIVSSTSRHEQGSNSQL